MALLAGNFRTRMNERAKPYPEKIIQSFRQIPLSMNKKDTVPLTVYYFVSWHDWSKPETILYITGGLFIAIVGTFHFKTISYLLEKFIAMTLSRKCIAESSQKFIGVNVI